MSLHELMVQRARIKELEADLKAEKSSNEDWGSVISMIADRIAHFGKDVGEGEEIRASVPPYSYDDWLAAVIHKREKALKEELKAERERVLKLEAALNEARELISGAAMGFIMGTHKVPSPELKARIDKVVDKANEALASIR